MNNSCCCKKGGVAVLAVYLFKLISAIVLNAWLFKWVFQLQPVNVWRVMAAPGKRYYVGTLLVSFFFVLVYKIFGKALTCACKVKKGLAFGLAVWAVGIVPAMIATLAFMTVNITVIVYLTITGLVLTLIEGVIVALLVGDEVEACSIKK